jgi:hypothetical protein
MLYVLHFKVVYAFCGREVVAIRREIISHFWVL